MAREEFVNPIPKKRYSKSLSTYEDGFRDGFIEGLKAAPNWISVKDKLPEFNTPEYYKTYKYDDNGNMLAIEHKLYTSDYVLVCIHGKEVDEDVVAKLRKFENLTTSEEREPDWFFKDGKQFFVSDNYVTHWLPLPKAPVTYYKTR